MTTIYIGGILGEMFTKEFDAEIKSPREAINALEANFPKFRKELIRLTLDDCHYSMIINGKKYANCLDETSRNDMQTIHMVPVISGAGIGMLIMGFISETLADTIIGTIGAAMIDTILMMGVSMLASSMMAPKQKPQDNSVETSAAGGSFLFSSRENTARQGIPVPIGYGLIMGGSVVIQSNVRSYPQNRTPLAIYGDMGDSSETARTTSIIQNKG